MVPTTTLYITDKTGFVGWRTLASTEYFKSEERNLQRHLEAAKANPEAYSFLDVPTARIVIEHSEPPAPDMTDDELLAELGA